MELLDTPGILWPKFEDQRVGLLLALIGSIRDEILNITELGTECTAFIPFPFLALIFTTKYPFS